MFFKREARKAMRNLFSGGAQSQDEGGYQGYRNRQKSKKPKHQSQSQPQPHNQTKYQSKPSGGMLGWIVAAILVATMVAWYLIDKGYIVINF